MAAMRARITGRDIGNIAIRNIEARQNEKRQLASAKRGTGEPTKPQQSAASTETSDMASQLR